MPRAIIIQRDECEPPAAIVDRLSAAGVPRVVCALHAGADVPMDLGPRDPLVVLGGSAPAGDFRLALKSEMQLLMNRFRVDGPVLGIGSGAVLVAHAAECALLERDPGFPRETGMPNLEVGWAPVEFLAPGDPLLDGIPASTRMFHWFVPAFQPPRAATILASSALAGHAGFHLNRRQFGFTFHLEVDAMGVADRLRQVDLPDGSDERIWEETKAHVDAYRAVSDRLIDNILFTMLRP